MARICFALVFLGVLETTGCSGLGKCPRIRHMNNFNITRFTGRWYEIERSFYLIQVISSCLSIELTQNYKGQLAVGVKSQSRWSSSLTVSEGIASPTKRSSSVLSYKVVSNFPKILARYLPSAGTYQILDTDYDDYALIWSCTSYTLIHTDLIWIWGRNKEINAQVRAKIYNILENLQLDHDRLYLPKNGNCSE